MMAWTQGGVRPVDEQGSRVMYMVEPLRSVLEWFFRASAMASRSACGLPAFLCQPFPMMEWFLTMTAPTGGLGEVSPSPLLASEMAICM